MSGTRLDTWIPGVYNVIGLL